MKYHTSCVFTVVITVVITVVFTVCSLRVHCAFTVIRQRARKGASSALSEAQLGPFLAQLSSTQLSLAQTSSAQLGLQSQPSRRARAAGRGRIARASRARASRVRAAGRVAILGRGRRSRRRSRSRVAGAVGGLRVVGRASWLPSCAQGAQENVVSFGAATASRL